MWVHEMTVAQKHEYGFVGISVPDMVKIGYKPKKKKPKLLLSRVCESCFKKSTTVSLTSLSRKNQTPGRHSALLCRECRINNEIGRSVVKGWLE